jgi:hypothetical protein
LLKDILFRLEGELKWKLIDKNYKN